MQNLLMFGKHWKVCDVIKIRLKRRYGTLSGKVNQTLNIKTSEELPILKLRLPNFWWSFYFILLHVASLLFRRFFMTSHMTLSSASMFGLETSLVVVQCGIFPCLTQLCAMRLEFFLMGVTALVRLFRGASALELCQHNLILGLIWTIYFIVMSVVW